MNFKNLHLIFLLGWVVSGCSHTGAFTKRSEGGRHPGDREAKQPTFDVPIVVNGEVKRWVEFFKGQDRDRFQRYLTRAGRYVPLMREVLKREGIPQDLVYLALIESGFSNFAYSRAKASGPWQFIRSTGRLYGLDRDQWIDERRDPEKATLAAARYLKRLYQEFDDWYLAMAAYNAGEGRIRRAIQQAKSRDFWDLSAPGTRYLRAETKNYVPKFIAATLIAKTPESFGFYSFSETPLAYETVAVDGPLDLQVASELAKADTEEMRRLNAELNHGITPPGVYHLKLPQGTKESFQVGFENLPKEERVRHLFHRVRRGESLAAIARRYGVSTKNLLSANDLKNSKLKQGMELIIPRGRLGALASVEDFQEESAVRYYRVKRGDTLSRIAKKFGVKLSLLQKENRLRGNHIRVGQRLKIRKGGGSAPVNTVLLAYDETQKKTPSKNQRLDGVEWLIRKEIGDHREEPISDGEDSEEKHAKQEEVSLDSVAVKPEIEEVDLVETKIAASEAINPEEAPQLQLAAASVQQKFHTVRRGENLWGIAKKYGVSLQHLKSWNRVTDARKILPGKKLVVTAPQNTSGSVGTF